MRARDPEQLRLAGDRLAAKRWRLPGADLMALCWHGAGGTADDFAELAPRLVSAGLDVLVVDGPGHGASPTLPPEQMRPSFLARLAAEALDDLRVGETVFVGFSWGAAVACWFGSLFPERTRALILLEGGHLDFADLPDFGDPPTPDAGAGDTLNATMRRAAFSEPATATYPDLRAREIPVLFVGRPLSTRALRDLAFDPLERLETRVPQARIVTLDGDGHDILRTDAAAIAATSMAWLSLSSAGSDR